MLTLPLGLSTFSKIRKAGYLYIDKTQEAYNLITRGHRYFLSRPRRFGKSLLVSTLKEILDGNRSLFEGLWIDKSNYQWDKHGLIILDLSAIEVTSTEDFRSGICELLQEVADDYALGLTLHTERPDAALRALVRALYAKFGRIAVLVDEYDSPILQVLNDQPKAKEVRNAIRRFFAVIKSLDSFIDFVFITGVSSFAKAGLFSGINNLSIMTMDTQWATICGYTDAEVDHYLAPHIQSWADAKNIPYNDLRRQIKDWYNGYRFGADVPSIYNPFSIMHALNAKQFKNFWFQTGTPAFLVEELAKKYRKTEYEILDLEKLETTEDALGIFEIGATPLTALMFQTGYLTVTAFDEEKQSYQLGYPNSEVRIALQKYLLGMYTSMDFTEAESFSLKLFSALNQKDIEDVVTLIKSIIVRVPYSLHGTEEKFYHGLLQVLFGAAGIKAYSEHLTSHARIDMILELPALNYVIEIKLNESAQKALQQIEDRKYYEALQYQNKPIVLLGLAFHRQAKSFEITYVSRIIS
jgi:hypothetical protein